jgi:hypothetical protein
MTKDLTRQVAALNRTVQSLGQSLLDLNDRLYGHEAAESTVLAKAATMTPTAPSADLERLQARVEHLEEVARLQTLPGGALDGEALLAKAAGSYDTPETLMVLGDRQFSDPTAMGEFASHVARGDLTAARGMLDSATDRTRFAKAADATQVAQSALDEPFTDFKNRQAAGELVARFGELERALASITARLERLERPQPAAVPAQQPSGQTVAKAAGSRARPTMTRGQRADDLLRRIDAYIDSPSLTGQLSSLVQQGEFDQVEPVLERAEQAHETQRVRQERRSWQR